MKCTNCEFEFNAGRTCPSCGYTHPKTGVNSLEREKQSRINYVAPPKPKMTCGKCAFQFNTGQTCPSCGHNDSQDDPELLSERTQTKAADRPKTSMTCRKCGLRYDSGETCPSCGHTNIDPAVQRLALANQSNRDETTKPEVICNKCGFRFNSGKTCPSCGHTNSINDPEYRDRQNPENYTYRPKPKTWVLVFSTIGIIINSIATLVYLYESFTGLRIHPIISFVFLILLAVSVANIILFINLLRMRKWAVWVLRILYTLSTVLTAVQGNLLSVQFFVGLLMTAVFWFADWSDFE